MAVMMPFFRPHPPMVRHFSHPLPVPVWNRPTSSATYGVVGRKWHCHSVHDTMASSAGNNTVISAVGKLEVPQSARHVMSAGRCASPHHFVLATFFRSLTILIVIGSTNFSSQPCSVYVCCPPCVACSRARYPLLSSLCGHAV